jgi:hypothetical protein
VTDIHTITSTATSHPTPPQIDRFDRTLVGLAVLLTVGASVAICS